MNKKIITCCVSLICFISSNVFADSTSSKTNIMHWNTKNGAAVYFVHSPQIPMLDIRMAFDAGSARDEKTPGLALLTNELLNQGSHDLDATQIAENFENIGVKYGNDVNQDAAIVSLRTLTKTAVLNQAIENFVHVITKPNFPDKAFQRSKQQQLLAIAQSKESPATIATQTLYSTIYPNQPYANPVLGTKESVEKISRKQVETFYKQYYVAQNATIAIVGAVELTKAKQIAEQLSKDLAKGNKAPSLEKAPKLSKAVTKHISFPSSQTVIRIGEVGITRSNPDYFPLMVGNYTLGGGSLVSRLGSEVREKRGLSYGIYSYFTPMPARGPFVISLATKTDQADKALAITKETLKEYIENGPTPKELSDAKKYITGSFPLRLDSNSAICKVILNIGFYHLPLNYLDTYIQNVNSVTAEQIKQAFKHHIDMDQLATITVGKNA